MARVRNHLGSLAVAALLAAPALLRAGERVPGTAVALDPPVGFAPAQQFPGFQKADAGASLLVTEAAAPVAELRKGFSPQGLASKGMQLLDSTETRAAGKNALLLHVSQVAAGTRFEKWILLFGDATRSVLVIGTFPQTGADELREPLRIAVMSAAWSPGRPADRLEGLPYRIAATAELKVSTRMGNTLVLTKGGVPAPVPASDPLAVVGASQSDVDIPDVKAFAEQRVAQTAGVRALTNVKGEPATIDGLPGYELSADARDARSDTPIRIYQLVIVDARRYFLVQGLVGAAQAERFLPQFRALARSLKRTARP